MKENKNQKGITLVALVVTIIVLLILAGVSLSLVAGSDGILGRASGAVTQHQVATIKEKIEMKIAEEIEQYYEARYNSRSIPDTETALEYLKGDDIKLANITLTEAESDGLSEAQISAKKTEKMNALKLARRQTTENGITYTIEYSDSYSSVGDLNLLIVYEKGTTTIYNRNDADEYKYPEAVASTATAADKEGKINDADSASGFLGKFLQFTDGSTEFVAELSGKISKNGSIVWYPDGGDFVPTSGGSGT